MHSLKRQQGFTLIEIIVGIVTLGLTFTLLTVLIFPQAQRSTEPVMQARASALGQALLNEILNKPFDAQTNFAQGNLRCSEDINIPCTHPNEFGLSGLERPRFRSVEDYHGYIFSEDAFGNDLSEVYRGFKASVEVCYSDTAGVCSSGAPNYRFKRVLVTVTTPTNQDFLFSAVRGNY